jgi:hypothetical protein
VDKKEQFKEFVKKNPRLISFVRNGDMNWQKFYEIYDLYGEDNKDVWKDYLTPKEEATTKTATAAAATAGTLGFADIINWVKNINLDSFQSGIGSLQKAIGVLSDLTNKNTGDTTSKETYKPRPLYRHFED